MKTIQKRNPLSFWIAIIVGILTALSVSSKAQDHSFNVTKTGSGQAIVFIPGITCDGSVWNELVSSLSKNYECHVLTLPGFAGQPPIDTQNGYLPVMREEIIKYIKNNQLSNPILIGHSLGGFLTLDIISSQPGLISKAIVVDGLPFLATIQNPAATEESMKETAKYMTQAYENMDSAQYKAQQKMILASMITDPKNIEMALAWGRKSDAPTVSKAMYELYTTDLRDEMAQVRIPVLVLGAYIAYQSFGVTKEMTMATFTNQFKELDQVKIMLSDKGRHFIMLDDPAFTESQISNFIVNKIN